MLNPLKQIVSITMLSTVIESVRHTLSFLAAHRSLMTKPCDCCSFFVFEPQTFTVSDAMKLPAFFCCFFCMQRGYERPTQRMCDPPSTKDRPVGLHLLGPALPGSCGTEMRTIISQNYVSLLTVFVCIFFLSQFFFCLIEQSDKGHKFEFYADYKVQSHWLHDRVRILHLHPTCVLLSCHRS